MPTQSFFHSARRRFAGLCRGITVGLILLPGIAVSQEYRIVHCLYGCPQGAAEDNPLLLRPIYALSYNTLTKSADWAAYRVTSGSVGIASSLSRQPRRDDYVADTLLPEDFEAESEMQLHRAQYVPLVNFAATPYWDDVNYLTNAVARSNGLDQGAWFGLEWAIRNLVNREQELYVVTGPVYDDASAALTLATDKTHRVPDSFFKIVVTPEGEMASFLFPQDASVGIHHCNMQVSLDEVEALTGLEFFPERGDPLSATLAGSLGCF